MALSGIFRINRPKVIDETLDDEVVVINFDTGSYYSLSKAAADIWGLIGAGATAGEIGDALAKRYTGSRPDIEAGVDNLIAELEQENLIVADTESGPASRDAFTNPAPCSGGGSEFGKCSRSAADGQKRSSESGRPAIHVGRGPTPTPRSIHRAA
jgi:hypothetical protein